MANKILNIIFKATDKATPVIKDITGAAGDKGIGGIGAALSGLVGPATIAAGSLIIAGGAIKTMMEDWQDHVLGISDFAAVLGISAEEASVLNGIAGDFNITQGDMLTVMENLVKEGFNPTVEGLIAVKDLILESEDPTVQLTTAMDLLGKKGAEDLIPMFKELTDDQLRDYIQYMGESEVVTDDMIQKARDQQSAMDDLAGAWAGLKMQAMGWAAPGLTAIIELLTTPFGPDSAAAFIRKFFGVSGGDLSMNINMPPVTYTPPGSPFPTYEAVSGGGGGERFGGLREGFQHGGEFWVGGTGGPDSQRVEFMATPGERVQVGGSGSDDRLLNEFRRLINILPIIIGDAIERRA